MAEAPLQAFLEGPLQGHWWHSLQVSLERRQPKLQPADPCYSIN